MNCWKHKKISGYFTGIIEHLLGFVLVFIAVISVYLLMTLTLSMMKWWHYDFSAFLLNYTTFIGIFLLLFCWFCITLLRYLSRKATPDTAPPIVRFVSDVYFERTILFVFSLLIPIGLFICFSNKNSESKAALLSVYYNFQIGQTLEEIQKIYNIYGDDNLNIVEGDKFDDWSFLVIRTPTQIGAQNWVIVIEFYDELAIAARIRTLDSLKIKPQGSPPDIIGMETSFSERFRGRNDINDKF